MKNALILVALLACGAAAAQDVERFQKRDAEVKLIRANGGIGFKMQSQRGQNTCEIEGRAEFVDATRAAYTSATPGDQCVALLNFKGKTLTVTTKGCDGYCGLNAAGTLDGNYAAR